MIFQTFSPSPYLAQYVEAIHLRHFEFAPGATIPFKPYHARAEECLTLFILGNEATEFVTERRTVLRHRAEFSGRFSVRTNRHISHNFLVLIINFRPGVLFRLTGIPSWHFTNTAIDAELIFPGEIPALVFRLNSTDQYNEMVTLAEHFLSVIIRKHLRPAHKLDHVCNLIMTCPHNLSLDWIADQTNLSPRQLQRRFIERLGIGPKILSRLARFDKAARWKYLHSDHDWLQIAIGCGYHDYSHLVRDSKDFAGSLPNILFKQDELAPERHFKDMHPELYMTV